MVGLKTNNKHVKLLNRKKSLKPISQNGVFIKYLYFPVLHLTIFCKFVYQDLSVCQIYWVLNLKIKSKFYFFYTFCHFWQDYSKTNLHVSLKLSRLWFYSVYKICHLKSIQTREQYKTKHLNLVQSFNILLLKILAFIFFFSD